MNRLWSAGPASSTKTRNCGSSVRRLASTHPAEPPPTMMWSKDWVVLALQRSPQGRRGLWGHCRLVEGGRVLRRGWAARPGAARWRGSLPDPHAMRVDDEFLRRSWVELGVAHRRLIHRDQLHAHHIGDLYAIPEDGLHQRTVVFHHRC